jgi:CheY-like chemotaxis protein
MTGRGSPARGAPEMGGGSSSGGRGGPVPAGMRILAIDDSPSARKVFQGVLMRLGIELPDLRFAADAPEALQVFTQWHPDVVFVDIELKSRSPGLTPKPGTTSHVPSSPPTDTVDGDTLTHQLLERNPRLHVVIVTACDRDHPRVKALLARGAMDVIVKPILARRVQEVLEQIAQPAPANERTRGAGRGA